MRQSLGDSPVEYIQDPGYRLFSPVQVVLITLLGTPLGGGLALAWNYALLERTTSAVLATTLGFWGTVGVCAAFMTSADAGVRLAAVLAPVAVAVIAAPLLQNRACRDHRQRGGQTAPLWRAALLGIGCAAVLLGGYTALFHTGLGKDAFSSVGFPTEQKVTFGADEEIIYGHGASEADARNLGRFLQKIGSFDGTRSSTVHLARRGETIVVGCVVRDGAWDRPATLERFAVIRDGLRREVFPGQAVEVELLDRSGKPRKTID